MGIADGDFPAPGAPEPLAEFHDLASFDSGEAALDDWLRRRARANQAGGASRTYVTCQGARVVGYYSLASGAIALTEAPGRVRRNMPDPIPMTVLGRLAIDRSCQGRGLGKLLLRDAILRTLRAASIIGVRGLLVHALSPAAKRFYANNGFQESPANPMTLMIALKDIDIGDVAADTFDAEHGKSPESARRQLREEGRITKSGKLAKRFGG